MDTNLHFWISSSKARLLKDMKAEKRFTCVLCSRFGFPIMIGHTIVATGYLMIAHVLFAWH